MDDVYRRGARGGSDNDLLKKFDAEHTGKRAVKHKGPSSFYIVPKIRSHAKNTIGAFSVRHFAGEVMYKVEGFLEKNRDALHGDLVMCLQDSSSDYVASIFGGKASAQRNQMATKSRSGGHRRKTKMPASIAFKFKRQLMALNHELQKTEPHYIRCIKTNSTKRVHSFEPDICLRQLIFAGVLECVRIRREGFPFRKTFDDFWLMCERQNLDQCMPPLPNQNMSSQQKCFELLSHALPHEGGHEDAMWQLGKTRVFMRDGVYETLIWWQKDMVTRTLQRWWRGAVIAHRFRKFRHSVTVLQQCWKVISLRKKFEKWNTQILRIQNGYRCHRARIRVNGLRKKRAQVNSARLIQRLERGRVARKRAARIAHEKAVWEAEKAERARLQAEMKQAELEKHSATLLQAILRGSHKRKAFKRKKNAAIKMESMLRTMIITRLFVKQRKAAWRIQAAVRRRAAMQAYNRALWARMRIRLAVRSWVLRNKLFNWTSEAHMYAAEGDSAMLQELVQLEAGETPEYACLVGMTSPLAAANSRTRDSGEPLLSAAAGNAACTADAVSYLLEQGAELDYLSERTGKYWVTHAYDGTNPFEKALLLGDAYLDIAKRLLEASCIPSSLLGVTIDEETGATILDRLVQLETTVPDSVYPKSVAWLLDVGAPTITYGSVDAIRAKIAEKDAEIERFRFAKEEAEKRRQEEARRAREADPLYQMMSTDYEQKNKEEARKLAAWRAEEREKEEAIAAERAELERLAVEEWEAASRVSKSSAHATEEDDDEVEAEQKIGGAPKLPEELDQQVSESESGSRHGETEDGIAPLRISLAASSEATSGGTKIKRKSSSRNTFSHKRIPSGVQRKAQARARRGTFTPGLAMSQDDVQAAARAALIASKQDHFSRFGSSNEARRRKEQSIQEARAHAEARTKAAKERVQHEIITRKLSKDCTMALPPLRRALTWAMEMNAPRSDQGWFYRDAQGEEQGPFTSSQMREWSAGGYLARDLLVRRGKRHRGHRMPARAYYTIGSLFTPSQEPFANSATDDIKDALVALRRLLGHVDEHGDED